MPDQEADEYVVSDPELITRVRTGDREAFGELYKRHSGAATTLSRQFARSATESDDLVSESFARVLDNLLAGKGPDTAFRAYLFTTIRNTAYDRTRKDKRLQFTDDMTTHDSAVVGDDPVLAKMESGLVATAFAQLPERWQAVLWHTQVEGETPAQVGALLGMAPGAVSSLAFRAREGLREAYLQAHLAETAAEQCRTTVERLGAWTRGGLSKREKAQVDAHLETCERCRALAAELEEVNHGLRGLLAPLLLGGAAAGYLATLGPVAPLAAPGTLIAGAGAGGSGAAGSGSAGSGAGGSGAGGSGGAGAAGGGAGAAGGATAGSAAATAAGVAAAAAAVAAGAIGVAALASAGSSGATAAAAGTGAAAAGASGGGAVGAAAAGASGGGAVGAAGAGASGGGAVGAGGGTAGGAGASAGAGTAAGAGAAAGGGTVFAGLGVGGLVAAGAALVVAAVAAVVFVVSGNSPDTTNTAGQDVAISDVAPASDTGAANDPGAAGGISLADPGATDGTAGTAASVPIVPGADPATTGATDGAVVPVVATTTQSTPTAGDVTDSPTADSSATGPGSQPNTVNPTPTTTPTNPVTPPEPTNPTTTDPTTTDPTTTTPPPPVADLVVTFPTVAPPLNAGATGTVSLTLTNNGDGASTIQSADLVLPEGVQVTGVDSTDPVPALRRATMGLLRAGPCLSAPSTTCTIDLPAVPAHHKVTVTLTLAVDSTVTGGDLTITVLGEPFTITLQVNSPAALGLSDLEVTQDLYAGGTGQLSVRVLNSGQQPSTRQTVYVSGLPDGVTVSGVTGDGVTCEADQNNARAVGSPVCTLLPVDPDAGGTLLIDLDVLPSAPSSTETATTLTLGDNTDGPSRSLTVLPSILSLDTAAAGPFTAGQPATLAVIPDVLDGVTNTGPITVTSTDAAVTFRPSSGCLPINDANAVSCASSGFVLDIAIPVDHEAGPLEITATDAGGRRLDFPSVTFEIVAAAPANIVVTGLTTSRPLIAGGTGQLTVQVTNSGALPSADELIGVDLPAGITVTDITGSNVTNEGSLCRPADPEQNLLAAAAEPTCTLPSMAGGSDVTLLIELAVAPSAGKEPAEATVTIGTGTTNSSTTTLNVRAGITGLDTSPAGPFTAGRPLQLTVTPQAPEGVTAGAVTLVSDDPTVTFGRTPDCEPVTGANAVTCQRDPQVTPTLPFTVPVNIPVTHPAGELAITAADEGDRPLRFTAAPLMIAAAAPANLVVTDLAVSEKLIAGGTGQLTVKVQNIGALAAAEQAIDVALPDGITATSVVAGDTTLCAVDNGRLSCELPPLDAGESRTLVIALAVPSTTIDEPGTATVTIGDGPDASDSVELTVASGISALRTKASNPLYTGTTTTMQIDVESRVEEPGPITFIATSTGVTFGKSAGCDAPSGTSTIVCDGDTIGLSITISPDQAPGTLPVTVLDNGDRKLALKDAAGQDFRIERAKSSLQIDKLSISTPLLAGGTGGVTVQVSNTGGQRSEKGPIEIDLPDGVELSGMTYGESSLCTAVRDAAPTCTLPEIDPGKPINVVIDLIVQPDAKSDPGNAKVVIAGDTESVPLAVEAGISALVADEGGPLTAGTTVKLTVSADLLDGVTEAGRVTLTAADGVFFGESSGCSPAKGGSTIDCDSSGFTAAVSIPANHPVGTLSVKAVDAGQRTVALLDAARKPFEVVAAPKQLDVSDLEVEQLPNLSGTITLKVSNPADAPSAPMPVDIVLPKGFTTEAVVSVFEPKFRLTVCTNPPCTLEPVDSRGSATLYVGFTAREGATTGPAIVTIDGVTKEAQVIGGGLILDLLKPKTETAPTDIAQPAPLIGGQSDQSLPIPPTLTPDGAAPQADTPGAGGVVENDPPTGDATPTGTAPPSAGDSGAGETNPSSAAPTTPTAAAGPSSTDTAITDPATTDATTQPDPTSSADPTTQPDPTTVAPSIEDTTPAPETTSDAPSTQPAAPAAVALTRPGGAETLTAGGTGTLRFSATNSGGERSGPTAFDIDLPAGVIVRSVSINGSTICESRSCQLPGIEPGASITVEVDIAAAVDAATGGASATIDGSGVGWTVAVEPVTGPGTGDTRTAVLPTAVMPGRGDLLPAGN